MGCPPPSFPIIAPKFLENFETKRIKVSVTENRCRNSALFAGLRSLQVSMKFTLRGAGVAAANAQQPSIYRRGVLHRDLRWGDKFLARSGESETAIWRLSRWWIRALEREAAAISYISEFKKVEANLIEYQEGNGTRFHRFQWTNRRLGIQHQEVQSQYYHREKVLTSLLQTHSTFVYLL